MVFDNKFGMFIHWGFYAQTGIQEQVYARFDWKREDYEPLKDTFNPVDYDPEQWVKMAKAAGMQYICFTTKHHDGFCMWDTKYTDYNIMNTPYHKDVLKMLADACAKYDMKLGLYYSNPDWHHPLAYNPGSTHQWKSVDKEHYNVAEYRTFMKNQMVELLTGYGKIYTLFWDIPPFVQDDSSLNDLARKLQPGIFINDRGFDKGDFSTPEREYKAQEMTRFTRMTEACNSLGQQSWGYREQEDFYSLRHIKTAIDKYMAMGASYLLNVGPDGRGVVTEAYADRLKAVGDWYNKVKIGLEGTDGDDYDYCDEHNAFIATKKDGKTYLHYYDGLMSSAVALKNFPSVPKSVKLLNTGALLPAKAERLPEFFDIDTGRSEITYLHISGIPVDELNEPIVLEIEW